MGCRSLNGFLVGGCDEVRLNCGLGFSLGLGFLAGWNRVGHWLIGWVLRSRHTSTSSHLDLLISSIDYPQRNKQAQ